MPDRTTGSRLRLERAVFARPTRDAFRGYQVGGFEQRAADVSVDDPNVVENYRIAHDITVRKQRGDASTEDLRVAMVHYRALFEDHRQRRLRDRLRIATSPPPNRPV